MGDTSDESDTNDDELYMYVGCYNNNRINKLLSDGPHRGNTMSAEICFKVCTKRPFRNNFNYFGTHNGGDCFCGNIADIEPYNKGGYKYDKSECNSNCSGIEGEKCGSENTMSLYKLKATFPIIVVSALAFLLIAAVLVTIVVCYRRKKSRNSQPFQIQQNQIIAKINNSSVYTEVMSNNITIIKTKEDKDENKTIHLKTQGVAASIEQDNKYESLSTNRDLVEHIYESDSIHSNRYESLTKQSESDKHTYASTEHAISQGNTTSIGQKDKVCNKYESLSTNRNSVEHTYESDLIHANQYESLTHKQEFEDHTYDSSELASHTSAESDFNQYQSLTMPPESDTHVYASTVPYSKELEMQHSFASS